MSAEKQAAKEAADQLAAAKQAAKLAADCQRAEEKKAAKAAKLAADRHRIFEEQVDRLAAYLAKYGNCQVPQKSKDDTVLATWVANVRSGNTILSEEQRQELTAMGFAWDIAEINESKRQQMVLEVCLIVILLSLSHNFTNNLSHSGE